MSSSKYDNEFKSLVINQGIDKKMKKLHRELCFLNKHVRVITNDGEILDNNRLSNYEILLKLRDNPKLDCAFRLNNSQYQKAKRVKDKINDLVLSKNAIFLTLTFNNKILSKTSSDTRRQYVRKFLKLCSKRYVANIDFGAENGREHYHAVVDTDINLAYWHRYGAIKAERVRNTCDDLKRVSKYVSKLTNHALKVKGLQPRLIYSRNLG